MTRAYGVLLGLLLILPSAAFGADVVTCTGTSNGIGVSISSIAPPPVTPSAEMLIDGQSVDLSACLVSTKTGFALNATVVSPETEANITAAFDMDPFITFGVTTTNLLPGSTTYGFVFGTPITPGFYGSATSTAGVTVTNGTSGTSQVQTSNPTYISAFGTLFAVPTNLGVDLGTAPCVSGPGIPFTVTHTCGQGTMLNSFPAAFYNNLEAHVDYTQTDLGSVASWSGAVTLSPPVNVPEPATLPLLAMGALLVGVGFGFRGLKNKAL